MIHGKYSTIQRGNFSEKNNAKTVVFAVPQHDLSARYYMILIAFCVCILPVCSDIFPGEIPENQLWTTTSLIEEVGITTENTLLNWHTSDGALWYGFISHMKKACMAYGSLGMRMKKIEYEQVYV